MTLTQLKYIVAVATHRSFSKAAESCSVSQPSLSTQIQKLESELKTILFDRSKSPIIPTDIGEEIVKQAKNTLREMDSIKDIANNNASELTGTLRIGVIPSLGPYLISLFLTSFIGKYPNVTLVFHEAERNNLLECLDNEYIDIAITSIPPEGHHFNETTLFYEPFVAYISKDHRLFHHEKIALDDLCMDDILLLNQGHQFHKRTGHLIEQLKGSSESRKANVIFESGHIGTLKRLVENNYSMTLLPYLSIYNSEEKTNFNLIREFASPVPKREVAILYMRSFQKLNLINAVHDEILDVIPQKLKEKDHCLYLCLDELEICIK